MVIGNVASVAGASALVVLGATVLAANRRMLPASVVRAQYDENRPGTLLTTALRIARVPGTVVVIAAVAASGVVSSATVLVASDADPALGAAGGLLVLAWLIALVSAVRSPLRAVVAGELAILRARYVCAKSQVTLLDSSLAQWVLVSRAAWFPATDYLAATDGGDITETRAADARWCAQKALLETHGLLVMRYRAPPPEPTQGHRLAHLCPWFLLLDAACAALVAVADGLSQTGSCSTALWLTTFSNTVVAVAAVVLRPYGVPLKNVLLGCLNALAAAASAAVVATDAGRLDATDDRVASFIALCAVAAGGIGLASQVLSVAKLVVVTAVLRAKVEPIHQHALRRSADSSDATHGTPLLRCVPEVPDAVAVPMVAGVTAKRSAPASSGTSGDDGATPFVSAAPRRPTANPLLHGDARRRDQS